MVEKLCVKVTRKRHFYINWKGIWNVADISAESMSNAGRRAERIHCQWQDHRSVQELIRESGSNAGGKAESGANGKITGQFRCQLGYGSK